MTQPFESSAPPDQRTGARRYADWAKESAAFIALALIGIALEYPLEKSLGGNGRFHVYRITWLLVCLVPIAAWLVPALGLPGSPWLRARIRGEAPKHGLRDVIKPALGYGLLGVVADAAASLVTRALRFTGAASSSSLGRQFTPQAIRNAPRHLAAGAISASLGAGVFEEIAFRLVVLTLWVWAISRFWRDRSGGPSRMALWCANLMQAYLFGLMHLSRGFAVPNQWNVPLPIVALVLPQTWYGVVMGALYLREGLGASILSHLLLDAALFLLLVSATLAGFA